MKIGFIGGPKNRYVHDPSIIENNLIGKGTYSYKQPRHSFQIDFNEPEEFIYNKTLLKFKGEFKYFYILKDSEIDLIRSSIQDYWDLSDIAGYDFD